MLFSFYSQADALTLCLASLFRNWTIGRAPSPRCQDGIRWGIDCQPDRFESLRGQNESRSGPADAPEIMRLYPSLRAEDVTAAIAYAAELARERVVPTAA
jgi:hypothetical protein